MKSPVPATTDEGVRVLKVYMYGLLPHPRKSEKTTLAVMMAKGFGCFVHVHFPLGDSILAACSGHVSNRLIACLHGLVE